MLKNILFFDSLDSYNVFKIYDLHANKKEKKFYCEDKKKLYCIQCRENI